VEFLLEMLFILQNAETNARSVQRGISAGRLVLYLQYIKITPSDQPTSQQSNATEHSPS
jgi:hypothetical protein